MTTRALVGHEFIGGEDGRLPGCTCGWTATASVSPRLASRRWRLHVDSTVAEARCADVVDLAQAVQKRALELRSQRSATLARRVTIVDQRAKLAQRLATLRKAAASRYVVTVADVRYLNRARRMAALEPTTLWLRYVELGGNASFKTILLGLTGVDPLSVTDFNLLALAINEAFADMGLGRPLDYAAPPLLCSL